VRVEFVDIVAQADAHVERALAPLGVGMHLPAELGSVQNAAQLRRRGRGGEAWVGQGLVLARGRPAGVDPQPAELISAHRTHLVGDVI
jgi:hypothetical protein